MLISHLYVIVHEPAGISKVRVFGVDICQLNGNQVVDLKQIRKLINQTRGE